jgi:DNA gyrase subunit B
VAPICAAMIEEARGIRFTLIGQLHSRYDRRVVEQMAIAGALRPSHEENEAQAQERRGEGRRRLDAISDEIERGWEGKVAGGGFQLLAHGARRQAGRDRSMPVCSPAPRRASSTPHAASLQEAYSTSPACSAARATTMPSTGRPGCSRWSSDRQEGRHAAALQRARRDEPEQLWETTLDRDVRSLLRVKNDQNDEADDIFVKLMGDVVEPRREFIQTNALNATVDT